MRTIAWTLLAATALAGCNVAERLVRPDRYIDLQFPVARSSAQHYPHAVDSRGALWYVDRDTLVRTSAPSLKQAMHAPGIAGGTPFWYDGAIFVVAGDGRSLMRFGNNAQTDPQDIPQQYGPVQGVVADATHRWVAFVTATPHQLAVLDVWKWYQDTLPDGIDPFALTLAGGPHGKKYLVAGDVRAASIAVENRWTHKALLAKVA